jgi:chaperonin GroEL
MDNHIVFGKDARDHLLKGAQILSEVVSVTMGPKGKLAVIDDGINMPHLTKDGVTVANSIKLKNPMENAGASILRDASRKTASEAGDGTTTTTVLANAFLQSSVKYLNENEFNSVKFIQGLDLALEKCLEKLSELKCNVTSFEQIKQVAIISANGDKKLGEILAQIIEKLGPKATVIVKESKTYDTTIDFVDGTEIDRGFVSPQFSNQKSVNKCKFEKSPYIFIFGKKINSIKEILPILNFSIEASKEVLIFAEDYEQDVIKGLILNKERGTINVCACKLPEFSSAMFESSKDLAALFGCNVITDSDLDKEGQVIVTNEIIGGALSLEVQRDKTIVVKPDSNYDLIKETLLKIEEEEKSCTNKDRLSQLERRRKRLSSGISILHVGAVTEVELKEKLDRVDDAINAVRVASSGGIVPGGGHSLLKISKSLEQFAYSQDCESKKIAVLCFCNAIRQPFHVILSNAGYNNKAIEDIESTFFTLNNDENNELIGYNVNEENFDKLLTNGIIDPYFVTVQCLNNSLSVSKKILEVGCIINEEENNINI